MALRKTYPPNNRLVTFTNWEGYSKYLAAIGDGNLRATYDRGKLELMSPTPEHEVAKKLIAGLLECLMEELEIDFQGGGSTTFRKFLLEKGMEPDECYWIESMHLFDPFERDAEKVFRPDLAVEVEVTHRDVDRLGILAALGVPEVWWWRAGRKGGLEIQVLKRGTYQTVKSSPHFPTLQPTVFQAHVRMGIIDGQSRAVRAFRPIARSWKADTRS